MYSEYVLQKGDVDVPNIFREGSKMLNENEAMFQLRLRANTHQKREGAAEVEEKMGSQQTEEVHCCWKEEFKRSIVKDEVKDKAGDKEFLH